MSESIDRKETIFFHIPFALDLMGKTVNQVMKQCSPFNINVIDLKETSEIGTDFNEHFELFNVTLGFHGYFELEDYKAFSFISFNFTNNVAVECIISLGNPLNIERYSSDYEVLKVITRSLEKLYRNGRVQEDSQEGRVYTWKQVGNLVSFISYPPSNPPNTGVFLSVQIRDIQMHPHGDELELWYNEAKKQVSKLKF